MLPNVILSPASAGKMKTRIVSEQIRVQGNIKLNPKNTVLL